jgi:hypothetical protein
MDIKTTRSPVCRYEGNDTKSCPRNQLFVSLHREKSDEGGIPSIAISGRMRDGGITCGESNRAVRLGP